MSDKKSEVWKYFKKGDNENAESATCKICQRKLLCKKGSTKGLWTHLECHHVEQFNFIDPKKNGKPESTPKVAFLYYSIIVIFFSLTKLTNIY